MKICSSSGCFPRWVDLDPIRGSHDARHRSFCNYLAAAYAGAQGNMLDTLASLLNQSDTL